MPVRLPICENEVGKIEGAIFIRGYALFSLCPISLSRSVIQGMAWYPKTDVNHLHTSPIL